MISRLLKEKDCEGIDKLVKVRGRENYLVISRMIFIGKKFTSVYQGGRNI